MAVFNKFTQLLNDISIFFKRRTIKTKYIQGMHVHVPNDFPSESYEKIFHNVAIQIVNDEQYSKSIEFVSAWESVAYRFTTLTYDDYEFSSSIKKYGIVPEKFREKEIQDLSLFSFFTNAHSFIESIFYALYILGSLKKPTDFPMDPKTLVNLSPEMVKDKFNKNFKSESLTNELTSIIDSIQYAEIKIVRNTVIHRSLPDRETQKIPMKFKGSPYTFIVPIHYWIIPGKIKDKDHDISVVNNGTTSYREWLLKSTTRILESTNQFVMKDFQNQN